MIERFEQILSSVIQWHMGPYEGEKQWGTLSLAMQKYSLILALHEADMEATYLIEKREE